MTSTDWATSNKVSPPTPGSLPPSTPTKYKKMSPQLDEGDATRSSSHPKASGDSNNGKEAASDSMENAKGKKSQLNAKSTSFKPLDRADTSIPDLSKLSLREDATVRGEFGQHDTSREGPSTPKKKKEASVFDTPRRSTQRQAPPSSTSPSYFSPYTPKTASSAAGSAPVTPYTPEWREIANKSYDLPKLKQVPGGLDGVGETPESIGRYLMITGIPRTTNENEVSKTIESIAEFKAMVVKYLKSKGYVIVVFHDCREAFKVYHHLQSTCISFQKDGPSIELHCWKIERSTLEAMTGRGGSWDQIWSTSESVVKVEIHGGHPVTMDVMQATLSMIGPVQRVGPVGHDGRTFIAEYYDSRDAAHAIKLLNGQKAVEAILHVGYLIPNRPHSSAVQGSAPAASFTLGSAAYTPGSLSRVYQDNRSRTDSTASSDVFGYSHSTEGSSTGQLRTPTSSVFGRVRSENDVFGARSPSSVYSNNWAPVPPNTRYPTPQTSDRASIHSSHHDYDAPSHMLALGRRLGEPGTVQGLMNRADIAARARQRQGLGGHWNLNDRKAIPEQNRVFPERILSGLDSRTTVMIKDVPNKLSRQELVDILEESVPGGYDFVYLRFDFKNCCNALYQFIEARVGKKWNLFSSEKVLQVSYADIQGKAALINKFKNSAVMGVIEPWRPQIFYSTGSMKGMPEPFPDSDNLAVRQRSAAAQLSAFSNSSSSGYGHEGDYTYDYNANSFDSSFGV
ncbi:hypothetical protein CI109_100268 [Kwoniella shandongensis]|uniref:Mei2-like C-terminal RNA recognition motif domain-containing protein n=1 Tax=Kwoniella shandongensis TaxID=1734106 RepID=A0AAJ8LDI5_9TREE